MDKELELNPELFPLVTSGKLTPSKIISLLHLKRMVDSLSSKPFLGEEKLEEIQKRLGVLPDIISWGDYFQTELGSSLCEVEDELFLTAVETVKFDLLSAQLIFQNKSESFLKIVRENYYAALGKGDDLDSLDEENLHLGILLQYFEEIGLGVHEISVSDMNWYESFDQEMVA